MILPSGYRNVLISLDDTSAWLAASILNKRKHVDYYTPTSPEVREILATEWMVSPLDFIAESIFAFEEDTERLVENAAITLRNYGVSNEDVYQLISECTNQICSLIGTYAPWLVIGPTDKIHIGVCSGGDLNILFKE